MEDAFLKISNFKLWAKVGVLQEERELGQLFSLDICIWSNFCECSNKDDVELTVDYAVLIGDIKSHAKNFSCFTIEKYSEEILKIIKKRSDPDRIKIKLIKCKPPIKGFNGEVSIVRYFERSRSEKK